MNQLNNLKWWPTMFAVDFNDKLWSFANWLSCFTVVSKCGKQALRIAGHSNLEMCHTINCCQYFVSSQNSWPHEVHWEFQDKAGLHWPCRGDLPQCHEGKADGDLSHRSREHHSVWTAVPRHMKNWVPVTNPRPREHRRTFHNPVARQWVQLLS